MNFQEIMKTTAVGNLTLSGYTERKRRPRKTKNDLLNEIVGIAGRIGTKSDTKN